MRRSTALTIPYITVAPISNQPRGLVVKNLFSVIPSPSNAAVRLAVVVVAAAWDVATAFMLTVLTNSSEVVSSISPCRPLAVRIAFICFLLSVD